MPEVAWICWRWQRRGETESGQLCKPHSFGLSLEIDQFRPKRRIDNCHLRNGNELLTVDHDSSSELRISWPGPNERISANFRQSFSHQV